MDRSGDDEDFDALQDRIVPIVVVMSEISIIYVGELCVPLV